ncbi:hypothetical protein JCM10450v2_000719 [Rhodotorula kratochvilovae]
MPGEERPVRALERPDRGKAAYLFLLGAFSNLLGPPISFLLNPRPRWRLNIIRLGALICSLSLLLSSFATAPWQLLLTQGLLYSIGGSMAYYSTFFFLQEWFVERRGFANGVCFARTAAGGLVLPFILNVLLENYGAATTLQALSVSTFMLFGAALPLVRPRLPLPPRNKPGSPDKKDEDTPPIENAEEAHQAPVEKVTARRMLKSVKLWVFLAANTTSLPPLLVFAIVMGLASGGWTSLYSAIINSVVRDDPSLASHLFSTLSFTRGLGALLCAPISSALIAHPIHGASAHTAYGAAGGRYGGVVLFAGLAMGMAAGCEGVEALLH